MSQRVQQLSKIDQRLGDTIEELLRVARDPADRFRIASSYFSRIHTEHVPSEWRDRVEKARRVFHRIAEGEGVSLAEMEELALSVYHLEDEIGGELRRVELEEAAPTYH